MNLKNKKLQNKILNGVILVSVLVLIGTLIESFNRMETETAYQKLADQRHQIQASDPIDPSPLLPLELTKTSQTESVSPASGVGTKPTDTFLYELNPSTSWIAINPDYSGWISVQGTLIDYPYVQSNDNQEYLKKDFYGKSAKAGSIFMDYRNNGGISDQNLILYGHNMKNGSMFHDLVKFHDQNFLDKNPYIIVSDLYQTRKFKIFSVYEISADEYTLPVEFSDPTAYSAFIKDLVKRSMVQAKEPIDQSSNLVTLITCSYGVGNGRTIVHALEVEPKNIFTK